jgi:hypothetical protein
MISKLKFIFINAILLLAASAGYCQPKDTLFILFKNDGKWKNKVEYKAAAHLIDVKGFVRDNVPKDYLDSPLYKMMIVHVSKDTSLLGDISGNKLSKYIQRSMSLYDLRDSLKSKMNMRPKGFKHNFYTPGSFGADGRYLMMAIVEDKNRFLIIKINDIAYFYPENGDDSQ